MWEMVELHDNCSIFEFVSTIVDVDNHGLC